MNISKENTLVDLFIKYSNVSDKGITFVRSSNEEYFLSYSDLYKSAHKLLAILLSKGVKQGEEVVLQIDDNEVFIKLFWACILGGFIPVPVSISSTSGHKEKVFNIWGLLDKPHLITTQRQVDSLKKFAEDSNKSKLFENIEKQTFLLDDLLIIVPSDKVQIHFPAKDDLAYIQFSSGSTGNAKGVMLTHKNLIANVTSISIAGAYTSNDCMVSWMPLTHDMGLIGFHLNPLFLGMNHCLIPTTLFVRRPSIWFDVATTHKATIICSPNFGYNYILEHCVSKRTYDWNLSHVRILYNGAEPISLTLCDKFLKEMKQYGLKPIAMCPVYGLAEASLAVSMSNIEDYIISYNINRYLLKIGEPIISSNDENSIACINLGKAIVGVELRILDDDGIEVGEKTLGYIQIKGDNVTAGYYNNKIATNEVISEDWLNTGDLGFMKDGCLYVTGRHKNIIILNGQNYYPYDIEKIAEEVEGVSLNKIAVVGFFDHRIEKEVVLSFVLYRSKNYESFIKLDEEIKSIVNTKIGVTINKVLPVRDIPRTTSGKLKRVKLKEDYLEGKFDEVESIITELKLSESKNKEIIFPKDEIEKKLYGIWKKVFKDEHFGVTDNFFKIGGNSLKGVQILTNISSLIEQSFSVDFLFENPTILEMKTALNSVVEKNNKIEKTIPKAWYPLSEAQKNILNAWKFDPNSIAYNIPFALNIDSKVSIDEIEKALHQLYKRHAIVNASIDIHTEKFQLIETHVLKLEVSQFESNDKIAHLKSLVKPFNLEKDRLYRQALLEVDKNIKILFLDFHHVIADGESIKLFVSELSRLLSGESLSIDGIDFKDYITWSNSTLHREKVLEQEKYWKNKLNVKIPVLELPVDFLRKAIKQDNGARKRCRLTPELSFQLRTVAKESKTTLHSVMFTAYSWLLHKISNKEVVCIGMPVSEKMRSELHTVFGMFVNSLPMISTIDNDTTFLESLSYNRKEVIEAIKNQHYPVQKLNGRMGNRNASRNNLFDTMFLFQEGLENQSEVLEPLYFDPGFSKYDISLEVFNEDDIVFDIEYSTDLFTLNTIENLQSYFKNILEQISIRKSIKYSDISLLNIKEVNKLIYQFNETNEILEDNNFLSMFNNHVQTQPNSIALIHDKKKISYAQLDLISNIYANSLKDRGVKKGSAVCVMLEKSTDLISCIIAILKLGAVYIPIETDTPVERIEYIVKNAGCDVFINDGNYNNINISSDLFVAIKDLKNNTSKFNQELITPELPAYIIYTSGTTGNPKGVVISHESLANYLQWAKEYYIGSDTNLTMALYSNVSFDLTFTSLFLPLCSGNTMKIFSMNIKNMDIEKLFLDEQVNIIKLTPSHLKVLLNNQIRIAKNSSLKSLIVGGENLDQELAYSIYKMFNNNIKILNEYGPTEATIGCMIYIFNPKDKNTSVPIGKPIHNTYTYLLDKDLKPVPNGVDGNLYVSGKGLAKCYWKNDTLTNEKFIDNPFLEGERMYNTGDIARRNYKNDLIFIGRRDSQVKINGFRVEVEEIETLFRKHEAIIDCVVVPKTISKRTFLIAFIVEKQSKKKLSIINLKNYLAGSVPYYMIPEKIILVDEIPLTNNGKANLKELNNLIKDSIEGNYEEEINLKGNEVLEILRQTWKEVLKLDTISDKDSFYEIGGDSIKAAQIVSKLQEKEIQLSIKEILTYNTLEQISTFLASRSIDEKKQKSFEHSLLGERKNTPIEWWFFEQQFENSNFYNQSVFLKFNKTIDKNLLEKAFEILIEHHDNLRINANENIIFYNESHIKSTISINEYQLINYNQEELKNILINIKDSFVLSSSLLIKAAIIKVINDNFEGLLITAHHLLVDGVSWRIILEDIYSIYHSLVNDRDINIPRKSVSVKGWVKESKLFYNDETLSDELDFWKKTETESFLFPEKFYTRNKQEELKANYYLGEINLKVNILFNEITQGKNVFNVDKQIILILSWVLAINQKASSNTIVFQIESNGRNGLDVDISRTIGWFTTFYPLKINVEGKDLTTLLLEVKESMRKIPNQGLGYMLLNQKGLLKDSSFMFPEVRFNYLGEFGEEMNNDLFELWTMENGIESSKKNKVTAKIEINIFIINNQINYKIVNSQLIEPSIINGLLQNFEKRLYEVLRLIENTEEVYYSPSDFSSSTLNIDDLNSLFE